MGTLLLWIGGIGLAKCESCEGIESCLGIGETCGLCPGIGGGLHPVIGEGLHPFIGETA